MIPLVRYALERELALWRSGGHIPVLWWRDDDARRDTPALARLIALSARHDLPLTLAIVPDDRVEELAALAAGNPLLTLAQHGVAHANRAPEGEPPSEIVATDTIEAAASMIGGARARMAEANAAPALFVPPWNRTEPPLEAALATVGERRLSGFGGYSQHGALTRIDTHLDILRWGGGARFRGEGRFLGRFRRLLEQRRKAGLWEEPMGLLTHHLVHDEPAWAFLERFLAWTRGACMMRSADWVFSGASTERRAASA